MPKKRPSFPRIADHASVLRSVPANSVLITEEREDGILYYDDLPFARNCLVNVDNSPDSLLAEIRAKPKVRLPWVNRSARRIAFADSRLLSIPKRTRAMLTRYIGQTPEISDESDKKWALDIPIVWIRWTHPDKPAAPWFLNHRLVWEDMAPFSTIVRDLSLEEFHRRMGAEKGERLTNLFSSVNARNWWAKAVRGAGWSDTDYARAINLIASTPYLTQEPNRIDVPG